MTQRNDLHESYLREELSAPGNDRSFGIVFAVVFAAVGLWPLLSGNGVRFWALGVSAAFVLAALLWPRALRPASVLWMRLGLLLHRIVSPLVLCVLFYFSVVPTGLVMRALGKDPLRLRFDRNAASYWIQRQPPGPAPESLRNQF